MTGFYFPETEQTGLFRDLHPNWRLGIVEEYTDVYFIDTETIF